MAETKEVHGYKIRFNKDIKEWEAYRVMHARKWIDNEWIARDEEAVFLSYRANSYNEFEEELTKKILVGLKNEVKNEIHEISCKIAERIPYTKICWCQRYPTHIAKDCHEHNVTPRHFFGDLDVACNCGAGDQESNNSPYIS